MSGPTMMRWVLAAGAGVAALVAAGAAGGCARREAPAPLVRPAAGETMFAPVSMRLHPTFTRVRNWTAPAGIEPAVLAPDGIEAELEFSDAFGDPVKAEGRVVFELFEYRTDAADVRGRRITTPFVGSLLTEAEQRARWNRTTRTYSFRLALPGLDPRRAYVLTATFEPRSGPRFFSRIILQPPGGG